MSFIFDERPSESPFVETFWRTRSDHEGVFISKAVSRWEMVVWKHDTQTGITVRGPETTATHADTPAHAEFFGIQFRLGTFMPYLPLNNLVDGSLTLPEATGKSFWLRGAAWQLPSYDNVDVFVDWLVRNELLVHDPIIATVLQGQPHELSVRALQYHFVRATGLTQSTIRQIERARHAAVLLAQGVSILDAVHKVGYFDQAHLTKSLRRFVGQTPLQIAQPRLSK